jgi:uncharacterized protein (DUF1499 family)
MARRRITEHPVSRLALWSRRLALFSLAAALLSIVIVRSGFLEIEPALATFIGALALSGVAMLLAILSLVVIWREGVAGAGLAFSTLAIGILLNAYPAYLAKKWYELPPISDITTDPIDPPRFEAVAKLRPRGANPPAYAGLYAAEQQRSAYPDVEPIEVSVSPAVAYQAALDLMNKRKWLVVDARAPQGTRAEGRIEAVARTPIMGFRDDVVVRVRPSGEGARIDMRSSSRYGRYDFGSNAARIVGLLADIETATDQPVKEKRLIPRPAPARAQPAAKR